MRADARARAHVHEVPDLDALAQLGELLAAASIDRPDAAALRLDLDVTEPECVAALASLPEGRTRNDFARQALEMKRRIRTKTKTSKPARSCAASFRR